MPFRALRGDEIVWPDQVTGDEVLDCPACDDPFTTVSGHPRDGSWVSSHFRHETDVECAGGETDIHKLMKYVASRACIEQFNPATVEREAALEGTGRRVDVLATFHDPHPVLGQGVAIELQYRNADKDKLAVSLEYLDAGYSVIWADESDFSDSWRAVSLDSITPAWPHSVPHVDEWRTRPSGTEWLESHEPSVYSLEATLPPDWVDEMEETLERRWRVGAGEYEFTIERELSPRNASRRCNCCDRDADYYLYQPEVIADFRCETHHPANLEQGE